MPFSRIMTIDAATRTGWAFGEVGKGAPKSGAERLRVKDEDIFRSAHSGHRFMDLFLSLPENVPDLVVIEEPSLRTERTSIDRETGEKMQINTGAHTPVMLCGLAMGLVSACEWQDPPIPWRMVPPQTWQKTVLGAGKRPSGKALKLAVRQRLQMLGYFPKTSADDDRSDAVGLWLHAETVFGRAAPREFLLFGQEREA